jgi:copper chaperone CopZ
MATRIETGHAVHGVAQPAGSTVVLPVEGMTCQSCVRRVEAALRSVQGVDDVRVGLRERSAIVTLRLGETSPERLQLAVEQAGYAAGEWAPASQEPPAAAGPDAPVATAAGWFVRLLPPAAMGLIASSLMFGLYLGLVTLAQGFDHATDLLLEDWYLVLPIVVGFGTQVGLFAHARRILRRSASRSAKALAGAGTGTSGVAMVACCAHHVADILPFLGISGAALFLADYRQPMMLIGIATNLVGITVMVRMVRRASRCHA